jgi:hypothetical protein
VDFDALYLEVVVKAQANSVFAFVGWAVPNRGTNFGVHVNSIKASAFGGREPTLHFKQVLTSELELNVILHRQALNDSLRHV